MAARKGSLGGTRPPPAAPAAGGRRVRRNKRHEGETGDDDDDRDAQFEAALKKRTFITEVKGPSGAPPSELDDDSEPAAPRESIKPLTKKQRIDAVQASQEPLPHRTHSTIERVALEYVAEFRRQFTQLYPSRPAPFLTPLNECSLPKFVSTTVRPTQLKYCELYDYAGAARFVADFLTYEALDETQPMRPPKYLPSPSSTLNWRHGDSFDYSVLLASLLIGVGYDAYCVYGYAAKSVTLMDQTRTICPQLIPPLVPEEPPPEVVKPAFVKASKLSLDSKYLNRENVKMAEQQARLREEQLKKAQELQELEDAAAEEDVFRGRRAHCWVLVRAGQREVDQSFFIECTTGVRVAVDDRRYLGIECLWDQENCWYNMQYPDDGVHKGLKGVTYDLNNSMKWECVFIEERDVDSRSESGESGSESGGETPRSVRNNNRRKERIADLAVAAHKAKSVLEVPTSWVDILQVPPEEMEQRYPGGTKTTHYCAAVVEEFAPYYNANGLVTRITAYRQPEWGQGMNIVQEIRDSYLHRPDKLYSLATRGGESHASFLPGRKRHLKELAWDDTHCRMEFYDVARLDKLKSIDNIYGERWQETYTDRSEAAGDHLIEREVVFDAEPSQREALARTPKDEKCELPPGAYTVLKIVERFARNNEIEANSDVASRTYFINTTITVSYQRGAGSIVPLELEYYRDRRGGEVVCHTNKFAAQDGPRVHTKQEKVEAEYQELLSLKTDCERAVKSTQELYLDILRTRKKEKDTTALEITMYDVRRLRERKSATGQPLAAEKKKKDEDVEDQGFDFLKPYFDPVIGPPRNRFEAIPVKKRCLEDFQKRTLERAEIIQRRLTTLDKELRESQELFNRTVDSSPDQQDEYTEQMAQKIFKINVLAVRLKELKEKHKERYWELNERIENDPRMVRFFKADRLATVVDEAVAGPPNISIPSPSGMYPS